MSNFKGNKEIPKVPVRYKNKVLMPTSWRKAMKLTKSKKAVLVNDKTLGVYLKLKYKPKTTYTQNVYLGIDPGSMFDGYTVIHKTKSDKLSNRNFQFNHQLPILGKLKGLVDGKRTNRKLRRSRTRHRVMRLGRTGRVVTNTSNYYFQNRINFIKHIIHLYPVTHICMEDVKFMHTKSNKGSGFSRIEVGKNRLYSFILYDLNLEMMKFNGKNTSDLRGIVFPDKIKNANKSIKDFYSHCIDSYSLSLLGYLEIDKSYECISETPELSNINTIVRFIDRVTYIYRRKLTQFKCRRRKFKFYFRYKKGGMEVPFVRISKFRKMRIKEDIYSNHGKIWRYIYNKPEPTFKKEITNYGGTIVRWSSRCGGTVGSSKYWTGKFYKYYNIKII